MSAGFRLVFTLGGPRKDDKHQRSDAWEAGDENGGKKGGGSLAA